MGLFFEFLVAMEKSFSFCVAINIWKEQTKEAKHKTGNQNGTRKHKHPRHGTKRPDSINLDRF